MKSIRLFAIASVVVPAAAFAQVTAIGPFTGDMQDGYETQPNPGAQASIDLFGGTAVVQQEAMQATLLLTSGWSFFGQINPHSGGRFMGSAGGGYEFVFDTPAFRFGGYWGTNADTPGATATFFDAANVQIGGPMAVGAPLLQWQWDGWEFSGAGVTRVHIDPSNQFNGFIMTDDIEYTAVVPEPGAIVALVAGLGMLLIRRKR